MKAKKVLDLLKDVEEPKEKMVESKEEAKKKKEDAKQAFLKSKAQCLFQQVKCKAIGLNRCPVCQDILRSTSSKGKCPSRQEEANHGAPTNINGEFIKEKGTCRGSSSIVNDVARAVS